MTRLRGLKDLVHDAVEQGAIAVERIHRSSAAKPFEVLRLIPVLEGPVGTLQSLHDAALSGTYGMVRWVNRAVDGALDVALDLFEHRQLSQANARLPSSTDHLLVGDTSKNA